MRRNDFDRFNVSFQGLDSSQREVRANEALGVHIPAARAMFEEIVGDLSETRFGIGLPSKAFPPRGIHGSPSGDLSARAIFDRGLRVHLAGTLGR